MKKNLRNISNLYKIFCLKGIPIENFGFKANPNEEIVILGNGPSLADSLNCPADKKLITEKKKMCVNEFILSESFFDLKPEFLILMDPAYWAKEPSERFIAKFNLMRESLVKIDWPFTIFISKYGEKNNFCRDIPKKNKNVKIIYIDTKETKAKNSNVRFLEYRANQAMPCVQNVLVAAVYLAINMGFAKTYIFGADHSWHENIFVDKSNIVRIKDSHFYDKEEVEYRPFYKDQSGNAVFRMHELFNAFAIQHKSYTELEEYAVFMKKKIYNASKKSFIDAFERMNIL